MPLLLDGCIELDEALFELRREGEVIPLEPQAFDVLVHLVSHRDHVVSKEELMDTIWGGRFVSETAVTSRIKQVRRALGDDGQSQRLIRTLHGRGYRFVADVTQLPDGERTEASPDPVSQSEVPRQQVRYTVSDGLHIAYQVSGAAEPDIVLISGFVSHLDLDWENPHHAHFLDELGRMGRLIRFDKRGTGMSDRPAGVPDLETRMHDVLAVMDAVGSQRAVIIGYSEGGPMAALLAATHPDRVTSLVLYGSYARRTWAPDYPWAQTREERAVYTEKLVTEWDWEADMRMRNPSSDAAMRAWWSRRMRAAATPSTIRAVMDMNDMVDVREVLPSVGVPTLVLHRRGDALFKADEAVYLAENIPGAQLQLLDGVDHFVAGDPQQLIEAIGPFVAAQPAAVVRRVLASVVAVTGPDTTRLVEYLRTAGGRVRHDESDNPIVLFEGPGTAVREVVKGLAHGIVAGVGVSIAEVTVDERPATGPGVRLASRIAGETPRGEVHVSAAVGALLPGSGIELEPLAGSTEFLVVPA